MTANITKLILDLATEDFVGLWEVVWRARSVAESTGASIAEAELRTEAIRLIDDGSIHLYHGVHFAGDECEVDRAHATDVIKNPSNWVPPGTAMEHYRITASEHGESQYRQLFRQ
jgi:hypothetical protein